MAAEKSLALVLRVTEFSETSCVVLLFTRDFGRVSGLAKGARRPKSPFETSLDLLALCRIVFLPKPHDQLAILTEAKLERRFRGAERSLAAVHAGYFLVELLRELTVPGDAQPELFDLAAETIRALEHGPLSPAAAALRFELEALRLAGHGPSWTRCVETGVPVALEGRVVFDPLGGGVLAPERAAGRPHIRKIPAGTIKLLEVFSRTDDDSWRRCRLDRRGWAEVRAVLDTYWSHLLGFRPRTLNVLGNLTET